jgi:hypothetical protein
VSVGMSLVINATFAFERIASVHAGPKEIFSRRGASISSATPTLSDGLHLAYEEIESAKDRRPSKRTLRSP